ncbi:MAG: hypothetical protein HYZ17_11570 [Betaproteobacteria bacterium]|nr:hypothetical protein [Betaproteobacteria bacterium]
MTVIDLALAVLVGFIAGRVLGHWQLLRQENEWLAAMRRLRDLDCLSPPAPKVEEIVMRYESNATVADAACPSRFRRRRQQGFQ